MDVSSIASLMENLLQMFTIELLVCLSNYLVILSSDTVKAKYLNSHRAVTKVSYLELQDLGKR